jgi:hypothetical protein
VVRFLAAVAGPVEAVASLLVTDSEVSALYLVRNPEKLGALDHEVSLQR